MISATYPNLPAGWICRSDGPALFSQLMPGVYVFWRWWCARRRGRFMGTEHRALNETRSRMQRGAVAVCGCLQTRPFRVHRKIFHLRCCSNSDPARALDYSQQVVMEFELAAAKTERSIYTPHRINFISAILVLHYFHAKML